MATFLSEPVEPRGFEIVARKVAAGEIPTDSLVEWSSEAISRLVDRLYVVIRHDYMPRDQEALRNAIQRLEAVLNLGEFDDNSEEQARATVLRALSNRNARRYEVARILAEEVLARAPAQGWAEVRYDAFITLADAAAQQGQPVTSQEHYASAFELAEKLGDDIAGGRALLNMAALSNSSGRPGRAVELSKEAFERFLDVDAGTLAGWALIQQCAAFQVLGEDDRALESADRARNLFEVLTSDHGIATSYMHIGTCHHCAGQLHEAHHAYERAHSVARHADLGDIDNVEIYRAILAVELGKLDVARTALEELEQRTSQSGRLPHLLVVQTGLIAESALRGDLDATAEWLQRAQNLHERIGYYEPMVPRLLDIAASAAEEASPQLAADLRVLLASQQNSVSHGE